MAKNQSKNIICLKCGNAFFPIICRCKVYPV